MAQQMVTQRCLEQFGTVRSDVTQLCKVECDVTDLCKYDFDDLSPNTADITETPTKRNKRKLSEPKKRTTDFSIKRLCPDSPVGSVADSDTSDYHCEPVSQTMDLSVKTAKTNKCRSRTPLKIPTVPYHPQCRHDSYFNKSSSREEVTSPPLYEVDNTQLAAHILNADRCNATPMQRFGHYPAETNTSDDGDMYGNSSSKQRKNYKNMTRARRVEANARERTRVHTISAAFEALRRAVPSYSYNQKLSKLAILRIASTYILSLARLADMDSGCNSAPDALSFSECVDLCTQTIQTEGRARRRH